MRFNKPRRVPPATDHARIVDLETRLLALQTENIRLTAYCAELAASLATIINELSKTTLEHQAPDGTTRRGRFMDVLFFDDLGILPSSNGEGGQ